jgi:hypothetical protein
MGFIAVLPFNSEHKGKVCMNLKFCVGGSHMENLECAIPSGYDREQRTPQIPLKRPKRPLHLSLKLFHINHKIVNAIPWDIADAYHRF